MVPRNSVNHTKKNVIPTISGTSVPVAPHLRGAALVGIFMFRFIFAGRYALPDIEFFSVVL